MMRNNKTNYRYEYGKLNKRKKKYASMDFDAVLDEIGELGRFQLINYALLCLPVFFGAANSLSYVFTAGIPDYRCFIPGCDNPLSPDYAAGYVSAAVPPLRPSGPYKPTQCDIFARTNDSVVGECGLGDFTNRTLRCNAWVYADNEVTIVNEWNITCFEKQWMLSLVGTLHFAGIVCGSGFFGFLADRFGRKLVFIFCILLMSVTGILQAVATDYVMFCVFAFMNALGTSGVYPLAFIIGVEMVGRKKREMSGIVLNYFYALGEAAVGLAAWLFPHWVTLQLLVSAPAAVFLIYYWFVPESVRWLMAKQRNKKAYKIIKKAARVNNVVLSDVLLATFQEAHSDKLSKDMKPQTASDPELDSDNNDEEEPAKVRLLPLFLASIKSRIMVGRFFIMFYIWATNAFVFYGLSLNSINMSGNKYLNFVLVEIPGYTLAWVAMNKMGRRWSLAGSLFLCAISCLGAAYTPFDLVWLSTILFLLGKLGITSAFGIVYVHTAELLPTGIRSGGVGVSSTLARVGAMVAPFVPLLGVYMESLPLLLFGLTALLGGIFALILPETLGCRLPDTVEEAERIGSKEQVLEST